MKHWILILALILAGAGCSGLGQKRTGAMPAPSSQDDGMYDAYTVAEETEAAYPGDMKADMPPSPPAAKRASMMREEAPPEMSAPSPAVDAGGSAEPSAPEAPAVDTPDTAEPMVIYSGFLRLRVKRLLETVDEITRITTESGGYVESFSGNVIIVRIPAVDFDGVMDRFSRVGTQLERSIRAADVTAQFTDLTARLKVYEESRDRLLKLLEKPQDVKERLYILQEIKRISEEIEIISATLAAMRNLVDYFTITLQLEPIVDNRITISHKSPFPWIRNLQAHHSTILEGAKTIEMTLPAAFVRFEDDDDYRAQSADTTIIRAGRLDNDPRGTSAWWSSAVHHEISGRGEILEKEGQAGQLSWKLYRNDDLQPRWWLIAVFAMDRHLWVVEVFYPDAEAVEKHHEDVLRSLATFKVKP